MTMRPLETGDFARADHALTRRHRQAARRTYRLAEYAFGAPVDEWIRRDHPGLMFFRWTDGSALSTTPGLSSPRGSTYSRLICHTSRPGLPLSYSIHIGGHVAARAALGLERAVVAPDDARMSATSSIRAAYRSIASRSAKPCANTKCKLPSSAWPKMIASA